MRNEPTAWRAAPRTMLLSGGLGLFLIWVVSLAAVGGYAQRELSIVSVVGVVAVCISVVSYRLIRDPAALADPLIWFLLACGTYFGFGPLAYHYATPQTIAFMDAFYPVSPSALSQAQFVSVTGILLVVTTAFILWRLISRAAASPATVKPANQRTLVFVAIVLLSLGGAVRFGLVVPRGLGLLLWTTPGSIEMLGELYKGGLGLAVILALGGRRRWKWVATIAASVDMLAGLVLLSKLEVLSVIAVIGVAEQLVRPGFMRLARTGLVMVIVYLAMAPLVGIGRVAGYGALTSLESVKQATQALALQGESKTNIQVWWARLAYTNQQAFAIEQYHQGKPGDTIANTLKIGFVPRFLVPDKPLLTTGGRYTELVLGRDIQTATCPTTFAEG